MKQPFNRLLSFAILAFFIFHWATTKQSWALFTPPYLYHDRLYFIIKDTAASNGTDTLELLESIATAKQQNAPFNQKENIIDHLVNVNILALKKDKETRKQALKKQYPGKNDSFYDSAATKAILIDGSSNGPLTTVANYAKLIMQQKHMDPSGKEYKIILVENETPPFEKRNDTIYIPKQTIVFESGFMPFK